MDSSRQELLIKEALKWKLSLGIFGAQADQASVNWEQLATLLRDKSDCRALVLSLLEPLVEIVEYGLTHSQKNNPDPLKYHRWQNFLQYLKGQKELPNSMVHRAASSLAPKLHKRETRTQERKKDPPPTPTVPSPPQRTTPHPTTPYPTASSETPEQGHSVMQENDNSHENAASPVEPLRKKTGPATAVLPQWKYLPVPEGIDKHSEASSSAILVEGRFRLIGARVRGKKHKHEGTNGDDWYEFSQAGPWTLIAVSDGAGSKKLSRVGAREACQAAVREMASLLANHRLNPRPTADDWKEQANDIDVVKHAVRRAMHTAYDAIEAACAQRQNNAEVVSMLNREAELNDFSATLLVAVHTLVEFENQQRSFIVACQVGDGMTAAITERGEVSLLGEPDTGGFSGETEFLTSRNKIEPENLARKTRVFLGPLQALMVMTDGVADDYFPPDPQMGRLWADLLINRIPEFNGLSEEVDEAILEKEHPGSASRLMNNPIESPTPYQDENGPQEANIRSSEAFAEVLGRQVPDLLQRPDLLWAGGTGTPLCSATTPQDRLQVWLSAYHVRGSFDDRTLVLLHRESL